jgi:hypothetical protein
MKKTYMKPVVQTVSVRTMAMIANSNAITSNLPQETPIKYGGVDEEGELDPASRRANDWEDEEEDY